MEDRQFLQNLLFSLLGKPQQDLYQTFCYAIYGGDKSCGRVKILAIAALTAAVKNPGDTVFIYDPQYVVPHVYEAIRNIPSSMQNRFTVDKEEGSVVYKEIDAK